VFSFSGPVLVSKSWLNRALIIDHFNPTLLLEAEEASDDVRFLKKAIAAVGTANQFDIGMGGTTFRFFVFLISRYKGSWTLKAHPRLLERPQQEIGKILAQLGVEFGHSSTQAFIKSEGWQALAKITCSAAESSQFISGLLLSCWGLEFDINIEVVKPITSYGYLKLTLDLLRKAGMKLQLSETTQSLEIKVPAGQKASVVQLTPELDISSAFALIAAALIDGEVEITNWNSTSLQPDLAFLYVLEEMKISFSISGSTFKIMKHNAWQAINFDLSDSPDLFLVLSVLCALAEGVSVLSGGTQLKHKESDRIQKTFELLQLIGIQAEILPDGLRIFGKSSAQDRSQKIVFDPDHDHRMAMAAGLLKLKGYNIQILHPEVVNKSYPQFWNNIGIQV
jgi:3-phosphoshikimate 1-carboxyvinyltransferase